MSANLAEIEARLWDAADNLRANSGLASHEYSTPVLGIIFLRVADQKFAAIEQQLAGQSTGRRQITAADYQARDVLQQKSAILQRTRDLLLPRLIAGEVNPPICTRYNDGDNDG